MVAGSRTVVEGEGPARTPKEDHKARPPEGEGEEGTEGGRG